MDAQDDCLDENSLLFVQVACMLPSEELVHRKKFALLLGCAAVFIALFVINYLDYIKKVQEDTYIEWDVKTITAGDYTIEFDISETFYQDYIENEMADWIEISANEGRQYLSSMQSFQFWV